MKTIIKLFLLIFLSGCSFKNIAPEHKNEIANSTSINDLIGTYVNKGTPQGYITQILWPAKFNNKHKDVDKINVIKSLKGILIQAIRNNCSIYAHEYTPGTDFELKDGLIYIKKEGHVLTRGSGDVFVGPSYEEKVIALDIKGHGIYSESTQATGLAFLAIPFAISHNKELRFRKHESQIEYIECKSANKALK